MSMTQIADLTPTAQEIVECYFEKHYSKNGPLVARNEILIVNLYSMLPQAKSEVLDFLNEYREESLTEYLEEDEIKQLLSEYKSVVKYCFEHPNKRRLFGSNRNIDIPKEDWELLVKLSTIKSGSLVYMPHSGYGGFAYYLQDCVIEGFEENSVEWAFSQILLDSINSNQTLKLSDKPLDATRKYDNIYFTVGRVYSAMVRDVDVLNHLVRNQLNDGGVLCCIVENKGMLYRRGFFDFRMLLKEGNFSVQVVKAEREYRPDLFYLCIKNDGKGNVTLSQKCSLESLAQCDRRYVWTGTYDQLTPNINLCPDRYVLSQNLPAPKQGEKAYHLYELVERVSATNENIARLIHTKDVLDRGGEEAESLSAERREAVYSEYKMLKERGVREVTVDNLSRDYLKCEVSADSLPIEHIVDAQKIPSDCLLVGCTRGEIKVGRLTGITSDKVVTYDYGVFPIRVKAEIVDENYLFRCLMSEEVLKQAEAIRESCSGLADFFMGYNFGSIVVNIPDKETQLRECRDDMLGYLDKADREIIYLHEKFRQDVHMKKHAIGQTLFEFGNWWRILQNVRNEGGGVVRDDMVVGRTHPIEVSAIYENITGLLGKLQNQIDKFDRGYRLSPKPFALVEFVEDYIQKHPNPLFRFDLKLDQITAQAASDDEKSEKWYVNFPVEALSMILDNIVSNACCHGFKDSTRGDNVIRITIAKDKDNYVVDVANNGVALNGQMKPEDVFVYGASSKLGYASKENHCGIGGYEVGKLMDDFGGKAEILSNPEAEYPVTYRLCLKQHNLKTATDGDVLQSDMGR